MTSEEIQILIKDLCERLPYGVIVKNDKLGIEGKLLTVSNYQPACGYILTDIASGNQEYTLIEDVKPYLRPLSSITRKEELYIQLNLGFYLHDGVFDNVNIFTTSGIYDRDGNYDAPQKYRCTVQITMYKILEFLHYLHSHHFDYRIDPSTGKTLIESGLAIEAPKGMYKTK